LAIVAELKRRGCQVTYFIDESLRSFVEAAGAAWQPFRPGHLRSMMDEAGLEKYVPKGTPPERYNKNHQLAAREAELNLPALLEDLFALRPKPTAIVSDAFLSAGRVAAHVLQVPCIATLTMPGPAVFAKSKEDEDAWESEPWVSGPRQAIIESYGFDIFAQGMPLESYSPALNLVTTIDELFLPPAPGHQQERFGSFPFRMVGLLADSSLKRISNANVDADESTRAAECAAVLSAVDRALEQGRRAIYISLGTVATSTVFYRTQFGHFGRENGLADCTGRQLAQHVFGCCFEAFGGREDLIVALSLGPQADILEGLPPLPANFVVGSALPQLQLLERCHAFVTHAGANSMHEAFGLGVPMVVVPIFGDQPLNGDTIAKCGAGLNFRQPLESVTVGSLDGAMQVLLGPGPSDGEPNPYREAAAVMARKLAAAGGAAAAVDEIFKVVRSWKVPEAPPTLLRSRVQGKESQRETSGTGPQEVMAYAS
jgi:UDP:flavonoid glycosyltransferase YjiC (YdhE family)